MKKMLFLLFVLQLLLFAGLLYTNIQMDAKIIEASTQLHNTIRQELRMNYRQK